MTTPVEESPLGSWGNPYTGIGVPSNTLGSKGDYYFRIDTTPATPICVLYGPKTSTAWSIMDQTTFNGCLTAFKLQVAGSNGSYMQGNMTKTDIINPVWNTALQLNGVHVGIYRDKAGQQQAGTTKVVGCKRIIYTDSVADREVDGTLYVNNLPIKANGHIDATSIDDLPTSVPGERGEQGPQGPQGIPGAPGAFADVSIQLIASIMSAIGVIILFLMHIRSHMR